MFTPHHINAFRRACRLLVCLTLYTIAVSQALAQQSPSPVVAPSTAAELGSRLYRQGNVEEAVKTLREAVKKNEEDADAWHYLGVALNSRGKTKDARAAFKKALELRRDFVPAQVGLAYTSLLAGRAREAEQEARRAVEIGGVQSAEAHYIIGVVRLRAGRNAEAVEAADAGLKLNADFPVALVLKSTALVNLFLEEYEAVGAKYQFKENLSPGELKAISAARRTALEASRPRLDEATESLERAIKLAPDGPRAALWREQSATLRVHMQVFFRESLPDSQRTAFRNDEVTTKAVILRKPEPRFPTEAREDVTNGIVRLRAVLSADGQVRHIFLLRSTDDRLTEAAVEAARNVKFNPATKDGIPVSQFVTLEYVFHTR